MGHSALALVSVLLLGARCERGPCGRPATREVESMCRLDASVQAALDGRADEAVSGCGAIEHLNIAVDCYFRSAEALAEIGQLQAAAQSCHRAGQFAAHCLGHVAWLGSAHIASSEPADAEAQVKVTRAVGELLQRDGSPIFGADSLEPTLRAAAWHGIYAGRGTADPTAARSAMGADQTMARMAFAWESVRLLGPEAPLDTQVQQVRAIWRGTSSPPSGPAEVADCLPGHMVPGTGALAPAGLSEADRMFPGGWRFVEMADVDADLMVAVFEARWTQGTSPSASEVSALTREESRAAALTGARYMGALPEIFPDETRFERLQPALRDVARSVRASVRNDSGLNAPPRRRSCEAGRAAGP